VTEAAFSVAATAGGTGTAPTSTAGPAVPPASVSVFVAFAVAATSSRRSSSARRDLDAIHARELLDATAQAGQSIEVNGARCDVRVSEQLSHGSGQRSRCFDVGSGCGLEQQ